MAARQLSVSLTGGRGNSQHNVDVEYRNTLNNVDHTRTHLNFEIKKEDIRDVYEREFGDALKEYNEKQVAKGKPERQIQDYYEKIHGSKQEHESYEYVAMIGNKDTNPATVEANRLGAGAIYREFVKRFEEKWPQLKVFEAVVHNDEATPHLHMQYVPVSTGNKQGLETKNSFNGALKQMGYRDTREFNKESFELLQEVAAEHGIDRMDMGCHRAHIDLHNYKAVADDLEYPYNNDPQLMKLIAQNKEALDQANKIIERQQATIDSLIAIKPGLGITARLQEEVAKAREASAALNPVIESFNDAMTACKAFLQSVPEKWREYVLHPARGLHRAVEEVRETVTDKPIRLGDESRDAHGASRKLAGRSRSTQSQER